MPTADPNNVLFKIAHPDLYEHNPFNVLNLPVDATAKDIRRRKEDIEAAFDAGTEADEFKNILPGDDDRKTPTRAEIEEMFSTLEDPEKRIAYSLFWFWSDPATTGVVRTGRRSSNPNGEFGYRSVIAKWEEEARGSFAASSAPIIARHNLAVFHHMMGLAYELTLRNYDTQVADTPVDVPEHWKAAIYWWNDVAEQSDFWHVVSENVSALGDPRIDFRFARVLKDQFPFAFDQINVELAIDFAKRGREVDAKRQVEYMKLSQPDSDDVEGTFDDAFSGLLRQVEAVVKSARDEAQNNPKDGFNKATEILVQTEDNLRVSRIVLDKDSPIRNSIVSAIFTGVRSCLIEFGNATKQWKKCLALVARLKLMAENVAQKNQISHDEQIIGDNIASSCCCGCGVPCPPGPKVATNDPWALNSISRFKNRFLIRLYGDVSKTREHGRVSFNTATIDVPMCWMCANRILARLDQKIAQTEHENEVLKRSSPSSNHVFLPVDSFRPAVCNVDYDTMSVEVEMMVTEEIRQQNTVKEGKVRRLSYGHSKGIQSILRHPLISSLLAKGWKIGNGPTQEEIRATWGIPEPEQYNHISSLMSPEQRARVLDSLPSFRLPQQRQGCCIPFVFLVVGVLIASKTMTILLS